MLSAQVDAALFCKFAEGSMQQVGVIGVSDAITRDCVLARNALRMVAIAKRTTVIVGPPSYSQQHPA
jgi:ABC-type phosphate/phosphonate transport system substrate-binding protein